MASTGHGWLRLFVAFETALKWFSSPNSEVLLDPWLVLRPIPVLTPATSTAALAPSSEFLAVCPATSVLFPAVSLAPSPEFPSSWDWVAAALARLDPLLPQAQCPQLNA